MTNDEMKSAREVTLSADRRIRLPSEFARAMRVKPKSKITQTLVRLPDGYGVLLMCAPRSYSAMLGDALAGGREGVDELIGNLRDEWERRP